MAVTDAGVASRGAGWPQRLTEENTMIHTAIAAALVEQRRAALIAEAETARLARAGVGDSIQDDP